MLVAGLPKDFQYQYMDSMTTDGRPTLTPEIRKAVRHFDAWALKLMRRISKSRVDDAYPRVSEIPDCIDMKTAKLNSR